mmetsp:Transcript_28590/g.55953  ORF Transcript_28590/g.55953 Transcript_28590/m.55953 type:complete len:343 (-) Transcript_28590:49-1077(-)
MGLRPKRNRPRMSPKSLRHWRRAILDGPAATGGLEPAGPTEATLALTGLKTSSNSLQAVTNASSAPGTCCSVAKPRADEPLLPLCGGFANHVKRQMPSIAACAVVSRGCTVSGQSAVHNRLRLPPRVNPSPTSSAAQPVAKASCTTGDFGWESRIARSCDPTLRDLAFLSCLASLTLAACIPPKRPHKLCIAAATTTGEPACNEQDRPAKVASQANRGRAAGYTSDSRKARMVRQPSNARCSREDCNAELNAGIKPSQPRAPDTGPFAAATAAASAAAAAVVADTSLSSSSNSSMAHDTFCTANSKSLAADGPSNSFHFAPLNCCSDDMQQKYSSGKGRWRH